MPATYVIVDTQGCTLIPDGVYEVLVFISVKAKTHAVSWRTHLNPPFCTAPLPIKRRAAGVKRENFSRKLLHSTLWLCVTWEPKGRFTVETLVAITDEPCARSGTAHAKP